MIKLLLLTEDSNKPLSNKEERVINYIDSHLADYSADEIQWDYDFGSEIMGMLTKTLSIPYDFALMFFYIYNNHIHEIREGDNQWKQNPTREYTEEISPELGALSKFLQKPPSFFTTAEPTYSLSTYFDNEDGAFYAVGDNEDVDNAIKKYVENIFWGLNIHSSGESLKDVLDTEVSNYYDEYAITNFLFIAKWAIDEISREEAIHQLESWYEDDEDILKEVSKFRPDIDKEWEKLQGRLDDLEELSYESDNQNEIDTIQDKIDDVELEISHLVEEAKEILEDKLMLDARKWMEYDPVDWLEEYEYITRGGITNRQPNWIMVDVVGLFKDMVESSRSNPGVALAHYDHDEYEEDYNGTTYYIYRIE